jgi:hypothetical protein
MKLSVCIFYIILSVFSSFSIVFSANDINEPKAPEDPSVETPVVEIPAISNVIIRNESPATNQEYLFLMKAEIGFSDGSTRKGMLYLTNIIQLAITNIRTGKTEVRKLMLYDISRIDIMRWQPRDDGGGSYFFIPVEYRIYTNNYEADSIDFNGNIALLNSFDFGEEGGTNTLNSCFYDSWIEGKDNSFHWENTKATVFGYDFNHPVDGIVMSLKLDRHYSWRGYK